MDKRNRPRIKRPTIGKGTDSNSKDMSKGDNGLVEDKLAYVKNKATKNGRKINSIDQRIIFDLWHEGHYVTRYTVGDDNGKREGIEPEVTTKLVLLALKHILYHSAKTKDFAFLNHDNPNVDGKYIRIVLQDSYSGDVTVNIPVEIHFIDFFKYEITVFSGLRIEGFKLGDGQYAVEMKGEYESVLKKSIRGVVNEISYCVT